MNVNGWSNEKKEELRCEMDEWKLDILCLNETHITGNTEYTWREVNIWSSGRCEWIKKGGGNMIWIRESLNVETEALELIGDEREKNYTKEDIQSLKIKINNETIILIVVYLNIEATMIELEENKSKLRFIEHTLENREEENIIIIGNWNCHIGLLGERINKNGTLTLDWCEDNNMKILNSIYAMGRAMRRDKERKSAIDLCVVNKKAMENIEDFTVDEDHTYDLKTDHNLIIVEINIQQGKV